MTRFRPSTPAAILATVLLIAGCASGTDSPAASAEPSLAPASASAEPSATPEPTEEPSPTVSPSGTPTPTPIPGTGFTVEPNPAADALFLDRDECENRRDGYRLEFPEEWYTNTEFRDFPPCVWFSPDFYETTGDEVPPEIAITIEWVPTDVGRTDADVVRSEEVDVNGQAAVRTTWSDDEYWYVIQLGPTVEEGPNLLVVTSAEMGGDYDLNRAVMDRMMATIEFIGTVQ